VVKPLRSIASVSGALSLFAASACSQLLDIQDAQVDPTLLPASSGNASAGTAGSSALTTAGESTGGKSSGGSHEPAEAGSPELGGKTTVGSAPNGSGAAGAPPELDLCERYCDQVTSACKGKYEQFRTFDQCVQVCKRLPPGEPGDEDTNTVSCRLRQAEFADSEPFVYCKSAGPLGAGKCGSNCVSYCSLMQQACTPESTAGNLELSFYASSQACLTACGDLPQTTGGPVQYSSSATAEPTSFVGNTVFCRTYHVAAALEQDAPDEHCPHAMGGDPCIDQ
jgi:hypothetical protein